MSRNTGNKSAAPRKSGSPLLTGILVGMIIGVAMAAVLAWFIMKSPSPFVQKEPVVVKPNAPVVASGAEVKPHAPAPTQPGVAASGVPGDKPRFEFYKVLTDKDAGGAGAKPADKAVEAKALAEAARAWVAKEKARLAALAESEPAKALVQLEAFVPRLKGLPEEADAAALLKKLGEDKNVKELAAIRKSLERAREKREKAADKDGKKGSEKAAESEAKQIKARLEKLVNGKDVPEAVAKEAKGLLDGM